MKNLLLATTIIFGAIGANAGSITEYENYNYDVFFTNPICKAYPYAETTYANDGTVLRAKPANVYCKRGDKKANLERKSSPNFNLRKLINDKNVNEMFLTYLSFSDSKVAKALCSAIQKRNLKVTLIVDSKNNTSERRGQGAMAKFDMISKCRPSKASVRNGVKKNLPVTMTRGNIGGLGYAHNKIIMAKYKNASKKTTIVFSSGNMSSGTITHHENWHFLTTSTESYFSQVHECIKSGMIKAGSTKTKYKKFIASCRSKIEASEESDMKVYIVPSDGKEAMANITKSIKKSKSVDVAVHRFTHRALIGALSTAAKAKKDIRFVGDDDLYWSGVQNDTVGSNMPFEARNVNTIRKAGVKIKYMQTNESGRLLHHNKYIIFNYADGSGAVHAGAGNFTAAAFSKNFENYYFITIPEVVAKFRKQYDYMYNELATGVSKLPATYSNP
jgi:hypothetical protein